MGETTRRIRDAGGRAEIIKTDSPKLELLARNGSGSRRHQPMRQT